MLRTTLQFVILAVMAMIAAPAFAGMIDFQVAYGDVTAHNGIGFDDAVYGAARRNTFESVFGYFNTVLNHSGAAEIRVNSSQTDGSGYLAASGPYFWITPGYQNGFAYEHITTGVDPYAGFPDITMTFDFGYRWNSELDAPSGSEIDLFSVALHELTHGLGLLSLVGADGKSALASPYNTNPGVFSVYDSFLERGNGTALFGPGGEYLGTPADLTSNDVWFDGPNAKAANGGAPVKVYAPSSFAAGSSIAHIVDDPSTVMQYSIGYGVSRRTYTNVEIGILQDIGYSTSSVPEPSSMALVFAGGGLMGLMRWRRRTSTVGLVAARKEATDEHGWGMSLAGSGRRTALAFIHTFCATTRSIRLIMRTRPVWPESSS